MAIYFSKVIDTTFDHRVHLVGMKSKSMPDVLGNSIKSLKNLMENGVASASIIWDHSHASQYVIGIVGILVILALFT